MVTLTINGRTLSAKEGQTILEVARLSGIYIPTLCQDEAVSAYGACRLCLVEATKRGRTKLVASCLYPVEEGLEVITDSDRIAGIRRNIIELLLAGCPEATSVKRLAAELGVTGTRFPVEEAENRCTLCALCTRVCQEVVGQSAISLVNRGTQRQVALPFFDDSSACIACGSCAYICPTGAITLEDSGSMRIISWPHCRVEFPLLKCQKCGAYWMPEKQAQFMTAKAGLTADFFNLCPDCRD